LLQITRLPTLCRAEQAAGTAKASRILTKIPAEFGQRIRPEAGPASTGLTLAFFKKVTRSKKEETREEARTELAHHRRKKK